MYTCNDKHLPSHDFLAVESFYHLVTEIINRLHFSGFQCQLSILGALLLLALVEQPVRYHAYSLLSSLTPVTEESI